MISQALVDALNEQIKHEFYSSHLYLAMAAYCDDKHLTGLAHWMRLQADEEREHAMKFFDFIQDRDGRVVMPALAQPPREFGSPTGVFEQVLAHEQEVTSLIEQLYRKAAAEQDHATQIFLEWFISEQVEEEKTASQILETLRLGGDSNVALLMVDRETRIALGSHLVARASSAQQTQAADPVPTFPRLWGNVGTGSVHADVVKVLAASPCPP